MGQHGLLLMRRLSCIVIVLATRAGVHEAANLRALVSWPTGGRRVCLAPASMGTVLNSCGSWEALMIAGKVLGKVIGGIQGAEERLLFMTSSTSRRATLTDQQMVCPSRVNSLKDPGSSGSEDQSTTKCCSFLSGRLSLRSSLCAPS
jgi:hypothetical protein